MKLMKTCIAAALAAGLAAPAFAAGNVAVGASVATVGSGFGQSAGWCCGNFQPGSIVSGTPQADGTQWNAGTAFWTGSGNGDAADTITITLSGMASVTGIVLQADDNDGYNVSYWNGSGWQALKTFGTAGSWGLATRPEYDFAAITTNAFQITGAFGDGEYSVGQFEAIGTLAAVPEPETYAMLMAGLGVLSAVARRRKA